MSESSLSANLKGMLNKPVDRISTPSNPNIDNKMQNIGSDSPVLIPQIEIDQFQSLPNIVEANNIASKKDSMLAQNNNGLPDYTNYTGKKKVEMAKPDGTRIPLSIQKRITIMLHEAKMADEPLTKQDIYCRALSRYLESEGY